MTSIVIAMVVIVLVAAVFIVYVAYPHRGEDLPGAPGLGRLMKRGATALPTVDPEPTVPAVPADAVPAADGGRPETVVPTQAPAPTASPVLDETTARPTGPGRHRGEPGA